MSRTISNDVADRIAGCLLGGAVGDALGAPLEFMSGDEIGHRFGSAGVREYLPAYGRIGAITDDTQMTLFTCEGLIRGYVRFLDRGIGPVFKATVGHAYARWLTTQGTKPGAGVLDDFPGWLQGLEELNSRRAPGNTCLSALASTDNWESPARNDSKGLLKALAKVKPLLKARKGHEETLASLDLACALAGRHSTTPAKAIAALGEGWVAEEALAIGLYSALRFERFEDAVSAAVSHGGDSDSTGSIAGNLLGAAKGTGAIPTRWSDGLELRDVIQELADDLAGLPGIETDEMGSLPQRLIQKYPPN